MAGLTEIRGPYYTPLGRRGLEDVLETMGAYVDSPKFAGGSFALMPQRALLELIATAHRFQVGVSTGGFIEHVLTKGHRQVENFGPEVNLLIDHSQIVQLEALRRGLWGTADLWGKVVTFKDSD